MFSSRDAYENDFCPVRDELLGEMYRANENGLPVPMCRPPDGSDQFQCYCSVGLCGAGMLDAAASVRSATGMRSKAMRSTTWIRNTSTSRMKAKYCGPMSMSNCAVRICLSMFCATRQTMNASALAVC